MTVAAADEETNVRVAARVRPLLPREKAANCVSCIDVPSGGKQLVVGTKRSFTFDMVFDADAAQVEVYNGCVAPLLAGCMQGYNATVMAYGQTGSGKTFTLGMNAIAPPSPAEDAKVQARFDGEGITPQVIRRTFAHIEEQSEEVEFKASCCYLELYNEEIRDLLQPGSDKHLIAVRETTDGVIQIAGIHSEACSTVDDMLRCLNDGSVQRTTGATLMNEQSSRSHSIFTVIVEQRKRRKEDRSGKLSTGASVDDSAALKASYTTAKFHLVDLAGSERLKRTGAVGSRFRESVAINSGLLALGNVISALGDLAKRGCHVPYRDSKLTRLLQDSLGGNSRTWMLACISSADADFEETLNTLKYANRARNIKNKPVVNHDPRVAQLAAMQDQIDALRSELQRVNECAATVQQPGFPCTEEVDPVALREATEKLDTAERRYAELTEKFVAVEAECETVRRTLSEVISTVCKHLPAIWKTPASTPGDAGATPGSAAARSALTAVCEVLQTSRRVLGEAPAIASDAALSLLGGAEKLTTTVDVPPTPVANGEQALDALGKNAAGNLQDLAKLRSFSEMRKDSAQLIRKYLDEIKRLENELVLHRRQNKRLQEQLQDAQGDLQKDEEIYEEKMLEMRAMAERNELLASELREAMSYARGGTPATRSVAQSPASLRCSFATEREVASVPSDRVERALFQSDSVDGSRHLGQRQRNGMLDSRSGSGCSDSAVRAAEPQRSEGGASSSSQAHWLEQRIDAHIRRREALTSLEEDRKKQDVLLRKREQYLSYRRKISEKAALEQQEAARRLGDLELQISQLPQDTFSRQQHDALQQEHAEHQRLMQAKQVEGHDIVQNIEERLEGLQDEIDFREARILKAQQQVRPDTGGAASLEEELAGVPPEDAKDMLCRYCEKIIVMRQREKRSLKRLAAMEAQLSEKGHEVSELHQVLRRQDANAAKVTATVTEEYQGRIRMLQQQLLAAQQQLDSREKEDADGGPMPTSPTPQPSDEAAVEELQALKRDNQYYKDVNRELKRRLRAALDQIDPGAVGRSTEVQPPRRDGGS